MSKNWLSGHDLIHRWDIKDFELLDLMKKGLQAYSAHGKKIVDFDNLPRKPRYSYEQALRIHKGDERTAKVLGGPRYGRPKPEWEIEREVKQLLKQTSVSIPKDCISISFTLPIDEKKAIKIISESLDFNFKLNEIEVFEKEHNLHSSEQSSNEIQRQSPGPIAFKPAINREGAKATDAYFSELNLASLEVCAHRWASNYPVINKITLYQSDDVETPYVLVTEAIDANNAEYKAYLSDWNFPTCLHIQQDLLNVRKEKFASHEDSSAFLDKWSCYDKGLDEDLPEPFILKDFCLVLYDKSWTKNEADGVETLEELARWSRFSNAISLFDLCNIMTMEHNNDGILPELWRVLDLHDPGANITYGLYNGDRGISKGGMWWNILSRITDTDMHPHFKDLKDLKLPLKLYHKQNGILVLVEGERKDEHCVKLDELKEYFKKFKNIHKIKIPLPSLLFPEHGQVIHSQDSRDGENKGIHSQDEKHIECQDSVCENSHSQTGHDEDIESIESEIARKNAHKRWALKNKLMPKACALAKKQWEAGDLTLHNDMTDWILSKKEFSPLESFRKALMKELISVASPFERVRGVKGVTKKG